MATKNAKIWVVWGLGVTQVYQQHLMDHIRLLFIFVRNNASVSEILSLNSENIKTSCDRDHAHSKDSL